MIKYPIRPYHGHTDEELDTAPQFNGYTFFEAFGLAQGGRTKGAPPSMEELARFLTNPDGRDLLTENDWAMLAAYFLEKQGRWGRAKGSKQRQPRERGERELALNSLAKAAIECRTQFRALARKQRISATKTREIIRDTKKAFSQYVPSTLSISDDDVFALVWKDRPLNVSEEALVRFVPGYKEQAHRIAVSISSAKNKTANRPQNT
jgi:hypothetical protein